MPLAHGILAELAGAISRRHHVKSARCNGCAGGAAGELAGGSSMPVVVMATESSGSGRAEDHTSASGGCFGLHKVRAHARQ